MGTIMQTATVFLIAANRLFREGLRRLLEDSAITVTGVAGTMNETVARLSVSGRQPDLILLDLPTVGEQEISELQALAPQARVVILSTELRPQHLAAVLRAGVQGYLMKNIACEAMLESLRLVLLGEKVFPTNLAELFGPDRTEPLHEAPYSKRLSQREFQILRQLMDGRSNRMIANQLGITEATVKVHLKSLLRKINVSNRTQAAIWAMNNGVDTASGAIG
jgi:two-component system nitrate/nitrite response regulator NarL